MGSAQLQIVSLLSYLFGDVVPGCPSETQSWRRREEYLKTHVLALVVGNVIPDGLM